MSEVEYDLPCKVGDYTDFYSSIHHATAVGALFRPEQPLLPNYKWVPVGYHGRSSSINITGKAITRPCGQLPPNQQSNPPEFGASNRLDYELELGFFVGQGNSQGQPVSITQAEDHIFGACLLNDWSARDIQSWEYQPLGPFLGKNFATSISPWIVTQEALAPFRTRFSRPQNDPQVLDYLSSSNNTSHGAVDILMDCYIQTAKMRDENLAPIKINGEGCSFKDSYWTMAQMLTHHSSGGCNMNPGDLIGSGTQSGQTQDQAGSMLELTRGGQTPITLPNGETRSFLEDGDCIVMSGYCDRPDAVRIGFGEVSGTILPATTC